MAYFRGVPIKKYDNMTFLGEGGFIIKPVKQLFSAHIDPNIATSDPRPNFSGTIKTKQKI